MLASLNVGSESEHFAFLSLNPVFGLRIETPETSILILFPLCVYFGAKSNDNIAGSSNLILASEEYNGISL